MTVKLIRDDEIKEVPLGFSWTLLFFRFFVPLFRGDYVWAFLLFIFDIPTYGFIGFVIAFIYNKIYINNLLEEEWQPATDEDFEILRKYLR